MLGTTLNIYKLSEEIGTGGFGTVYLARRTDTNQIVAVKVLAEELCRTPGFVARFWEEARHLRDLPPHRNIVGLRDFGDVQGRPYLVMDYLDGQDLRNILENNGPLPLSKAADIVAQAANALAVAAERNIVHCDIKPENLRILTDGTVKVMDFGIASVADATQREAAGTPQYMAPELWRGMRPQPPADVYALGCVFYEALTGHPPFQSAAQDRIERLRELSRMHQSAEPDWGLFQGNPLLAEVAVLLRAMLDKAPSARPTLGQIVERSKALAGAAGADVRLEGQARVADPEETRPRLAGGGPETVLSPGRHAPSTTPITSRPDYIPLGAELIVQRDMAPLDLGSEACRAALIHKGTLFTGSLDGHVVRFDLRTSFAQRWNVVPRNIIRSPAWAFAAYRDRLLLHGGDADWLEISVEGGNTTRRGRLPEPGLSLQAFGEWVYAFGARSRLYRAAQYDLAWRDEFDLEERLTGPLTVAENAIFAPTAGGVVRLDIATRQVVRIGPRRLCRGITVVPGGWLAALYTTVAGDGTQRCEISLFDPRTSPPAQLDATGAAGQPVGALQVAEGRLVLTSRDGCVWAWDIVQDGHRQRLALKWSQSVGAGRTLQGAAASESGLLALVLSREGAGMLVVLRAADGNPVFEQPLEGEAFVAPAWWERKLAVVISRGLVEIYRVIVVERD